MTGKPISVNNPIIYLTAAAIANLHLSDVDPGTYFMDENANVYLYAGGTSLQNVTTQLVTNIPGGITHIRKAIALSSTAVTFDFSATPIKGCEIRVCADAAGTAQLLGSVVYCIDPPNAAVRDAWLTDANYLASDANQFSLPCNSVDGLTFTSPVSYIGMKLDDGTETFRVVVVGVEA